MTDDARALIEKLVASDVWILAIGLQGTPAIPVVYDSSAWDIIAAHRKELADVGEEDSVFPFNYRWDGKQIFPFFSSKDCAKKFLAEKKWGDLSFFQPYCMRAGFVAQPENDMFELLLDPSLSSEHKIETDERLLLRSLSLP